MLLKAAFLGVALLGAISPSLAETVDDSTKCAVIVEIMEDLDRDDQQKFREDMQEVRELGDFIRQTLLAADRAHGIKGKTEMFPKTSVLHHALMDTLAGCQDHPEATVRDMTIESYERIRMFIETGVRPPQRESLKPINVETRIVSVEAVTNRDPTDTGWFDESAKQPRPMIKLTLATPSNLPELGRRFALNFEGDAFLCRDGHSDDTRRLHTYSVLFDDKGRIGTSRPKEGAAKETYTYRLYLMLQQSYPEGKIDPFGKPAFSYDLIKDPQDVCIKLRGGSEDGHSAVFNSLQISEEALREAIKALK